MTEQAVDASTETPVEDAETISPSEALAETADLSQTPAILETPAGFLTLRPTQKSLEPEQINALKAIGIDTQNDPGVIPHLQAFVHMCQIRNLDPFAREAYLIGRGKGDNRKYTMQTGIDGYRKMAKATGRFIRVKKVLWTGSDDDERSYVAVEDEDGDFVRKRVWFDQWPSSRGNPGAAKVVVEHLDDSGVATITSAVADWDMYAPYVDVWEGPRGNRRAKVDADGKPVRELNDMWKKGGPHMLSKCLPGDTRIQTDLGSLTIRTIVNQRLAVKVRSVDLATGQECWQPVVNWWKNGVTRDWVMIRTPNGGRGNRSLRTTPDHPFWTPLGWKNAGDLTRADMVAVTSPTLSSEQEQVLRGSMLGDGALISRKHDSSLPYFSESHSIAQADYLRWKADALANLSPVVTEEQRTDGAGGSHPTIRLRTRAVPALYGWRRKPQEWLDGLDALGLAVWFMDDGAIKATGGKSGSVGATIHCCGFPAEFADAAVEWFAIRGIECKVLRRERNPYLAFGVEATAALLDRLAPYLRREGSRKVWHAAPIAKRGAEAGYAFVPVLDAEHVTRTKGEQRYDIEVEGTHTFVVNNVVVSNCAEALAYRKAFPASLSGVYVTEEMHRADQREKDRQRAEQRSARTAAYAASQRRLDPDVVDGEVVEEEGAPAPIAEVVAEVVEEASETAGEAREFLLAELAWQSEVLGKTPTALATRRIAALHKNLDDFTAAELFPLVNGLRPMVAEAAVRTGVEGAQAYAATAVADAPPFDITMLADADVEGETEAGPEEQHAFVESEGGKCWTCGMPYDMGPHFDLTAEEDRA